jgi:hypothetical protein
MIKKLIKILSIIFFAVILIIFYLSFIGVKTEKFNEKIINRILEINKKITIDLKSINFLLNPLNLTANITTKDPRILLGDNQLNIKSIKMNISLKSLILDEFSMDELQVSTKSIMLNDIILLARSFKDTTELFLLDRIIKDGFLVADIKLKFDDKGKIKKDYQINGFIKKAKFNLLNQIDTKNLDLNFQIRKDKYFLKNVNVEINDVQFSSPLIQINEKKDLFLIEGKILHNERDFNKDQLSRTLGIFLDNTYIQRAKFSSESDLSFNVNKKLKFKDFNIKSKIKLKQLAIKNNFINLKPYLPNLDKVINFENHEIIINYDKEKWDIKGKGKILIKDNLDSISYEVIKKNNKIIFNTVANLKNNILLLDFLDYEKKQSLDASFLIKGSLKNDNSINLDIVSLIEKNNKILLKNINLNKNFKITNIDSFNFNYLNNNKIKNILILKKSNYNYSIEGESFDAAEIINKIMNSDDDNSSIFSNFNPKIDLNIKKTYIDEVNSINNLSGTLNFKDGEVNDLELKSFFPNGKTINLSIKTNDKKEKITKLFTDYPKPLIKRYDFIKGFEEGFLAYQSVKKNGISNAVLTIDNFKVKEVPVFAKLLSLASLQGIADLLTGEGIRFTDFEMIFSNKDNLTTISEMYAIGPAVSILMDGYIDSKKSVSLRGTLVPATTINRTISSIPLLGNILIGKKTGEGVFGVSFKVKGPPKNLKTTVNPVKTLTPRFITRTLEKIKKN